MEMPGPYGGYRRGLCYNMGRIKHSCTPNAERSWKNSAGVFQLVALDQIKPGQEIVVDYIPLIGPRKLRRVSLLTSHGIVCACPRCSAPTGIWDPDEEIIVDTGSGNMNPVPAGLRFDQYMHHHKNSEIHGADYFA